MNDPAPTMAKTTPEVTDSKLLRSSAGVSVATFGSRILGLLRVIFEARVLGGGEVAGAWMLSFAIPNLFRRLLGEGALGNALIPVISQSEEKYGAEKVKRDLAVVFAVLGLILAVIVVVISGLVLLLQYLSSPDYLGEIFPVLNTPRVRLALQIIPLLMPYAFFICIVGVIGAVLNTRRSFFLPAIGGLILNIFLVGGLAGIYYCHSGVGVEKLLEMLALLVLVAGVVHLIFVSFLLWRKERFPKFSRDAFKDTKIIAELWRLVLPGMIGMGALQISFLVDRLLAIYIGPHAVPALSNVDRVVDIPIGIFALSLGAVLMADLSKLAAKSEFAEMARQTVFGLRQVYYICVPMALFVVFFWREIFGLLLLGGKFTIEDLESMRYVAIFYGAGIPAFCALKVIIPMYYSRRDMKTPLYISLFCIALNIVLNLILMYPMQQGGIALATVVSAIFNNFLLLRGLRKNGFDLQLPLLLKSATRVLTASAIAALATYWALDFIFFAELRYAKFWQMTLLTMIFGGVYLLICAILRVPEQREAFSIIAKTK